MPARPRSLEVGSRTRVGRWPMPALLLVLVALVAGFAIWYANHPAGLPTSGDDVRATGAVGNAVYVGVFAPADDFGRTLDLSGVKVHATSDAPLDISPLLCRDGALSVTTDPEAFCAELVDPAGQTFGAGDSIVLEVTADTPATATIDPVRLGFREGVQWGTEEAGRGAVVRVLGRDDAGSTG